MLVEDNDELDLERQLVARSILETLRVVADNEEEVDRVVVVLRKLSEDSEPSIRAELMEQIPHIGTFCYEWGGYLADIIPSVIVPTVVKYLTDINNQVRKTTQAALMVMVEQKLIEKAKLEEHICPLVLQLTETEHMDDHRTEAVALMSRMAPLVGKEMTERLFLERFGNLCLDASFHIRKVCASNFGAFSGVVGQKITEDILLYKFQYLCEDGVWGVRKACAEVFMPISCVCSMETRRKELAPLFVSLLCDQSRWVRMAAYQALGPFISTFADPSKTGLYYSEDGVITVKEEEDSIIKENVTPSTEREGTPISTKSEYVDCDDRIDQNTLQSSLETCHIKSNKSDANPNVYKESFNVGSSSVIESHNAVESVEMEITSEDSSGCGDNNNNVFQVYLGQESGVEISLEEKLAEQFFQHRPPTDVSSQSSGSRRVSESESFSEAGSSKYFITEGSRSRQESVSESPLTVTSKDGHLHVRIDSESAFNTFQFWRIPIPDIELDIELAGNTTNVHVRSRVHDTDHQQICSSDLSVLLTSVQKNDSCQKAEMNALSENLARTKLNQNLSSSPSSMQTQETSNSTAHVQTTYISSLTDLQKSTTHVLSSSLNEASILLTPGESSEFRKTRMNLCSPDMEMLLQPLHTVHGTSLSIEEHMISPSDQDIVPPELLEHYVSMTDPTRAQTIDAEITRQCAYSLPAVALTLGRKYWPCLKATYRALASDMQWKVRRTLASSLHELAVILGPNLATRDLLPVFASFLRDLDEVRIGVLQHLSNFLKLLKPLERREFLPRLSEFLKMDNDKNWRFRLTLSEQLTGVTDLYSPIDIKEYLVPMAMILVRDKVALVRQTSLQVLAVMMRHLTTSPDPLFTKSVLAELAEKFTHASKWSLRQTFAFLCHHFVLENSVPIEQFACDILPHLLKLSWDGVPNVRMAVAKCLSQTVWPLDYFSSSQNPHHELLLQALRRLQVDNDRDVRNFAHLALQENSYSFNLMVPPV